MTDWLAKMTPYEVDVALPRFKATAGFRLGQPLIALGMPLAFSRQRADFSGMVKVQRVFLSAVVHKAYVDVNEKGTEAAAATAVSFRPTMAVRNAVFRADHPFFFLIRDNRTGSLCSRDALPTRRRADEGRRKVVKCGVEARSTGRLGGIQVLYRAMDMRFWLWRRPRPLPESGELRLRQRPDPGRALGLQAAW